MKSIYTELCLVLFRVVLSVPVGFALPYFYIAFGEQHPEGGLNAIGTSLSIMLYGAIAAGFYFLLGCAMHYALRFRPWKTIVVTDVALAFGFFMSLALLGANAKVVNLPA